LLSDLTRLALTARLV